MAIPTIFTVTHTCGHSDDLDLSNRPAGDRRGYAQWKAKKPCFGCYRKAQGEDPEELAKRQAEEIAAAEETDRTWDLGPLTSGTDKQRVWGQVVRHRLLRMAYTELVEEGDLEDDAFADRIVTPVRGIYAARWWIDNREVESVDELEAVLADPGTAAASTENDA